MRTNPSQAVKTQRTEIQLRLLPVLHSCLSEEYVVYRILREMACRRHVVAAPPKLSFEVKKNLGGLRWKVLKEKYIVVVLARAEC